MEQNTKPSDTNLYFHAAIAERGKQINSSFSDKNIKPKDILLQDKTLVITDRFIKYSIIDPDYTRTIIYYGKSDSNNKVKSHFNLIVQKHDVIQYYYLNEEGLHKNGEKVEDVNEIKKAQDYLIIIQNFLENQEITAPEYRRTNLNF